MADEALLNLGTELILETAASSALVTNGSYRECDSNDRQASDNAGYTLGLFEFDVSSAGFLVAPTAGAAIHLYEQKINSDTSDAPDVDSDYPYDHLGFFPIDAVDNVAQHISRLFPINRYGGKYWIRWKDGGTGTTELSVGWELRLTPVAYGT